MPISEATYQGLDASLLRILEGVRFSVDGEHPATEDRIEGVLSEVDRLIETVERLRATDELVDHERELLGLIQLAVAVELTPLELLERAGAEAVLQWNKARLSVQNKLNLDLGEWTDAAHIGAIENAARPILQALYVGDTEAGQAQNKELIVAESYDWGLHVGEGEKPADAGMYSEAASGDGPAGDEDEEEATGKAEVW